MFFEKAFEGKNDWWRYLVVFILIILGYLIGQLPMTLALWKSINDDPNLTTDDLFSFQENPDFSVFGINPNMGFALLLMMFLGAMVAFYFIFKPMHKREFRTLTTPKSRINWSKIFFAFFLWLALILGFELISYFLNPGNYTFHFQWNTFIALLLLSIFILPIQTSAEELIFRGYMLQGLGMLTGSRLIPLIITSILFGIIHSMNPEVKEFGFATMQFYYISAGLLLGILTVMDDSLELALGVHAATNFAGAVFVGYDGAVIQTESLMKTSEVNPTMMTIGFYITAIIFLMIVKFRYKWGSFNRILEPVKKPDSYSSLDHLIEKT